MKLYIEINDKDSTMLNLFSYREKNKYILWAVVHKDILDEIDPQGSITGGFEDEYYCLGLVPKPTLGEKQ